MARRLRVSEPDEQALRLDQPDAERLIGKAFEAVAADYVDGALALLDTDPDLCRLFHDTEAAIDAAVKAGPTEHELRAALAAHVAVIREACGAIYNGGTVSKKGAVTVTASMFSSNTSGQGAGGAISKKQ